MTGCRIGKVRMKSGGAPITIISNRLETPDDRLLSAANYIARQPDLQGFVVIGVVAGPEYRIAVNLENTDVPETLIPAYVAEILRTNLLTRSEAAEIFDDKSEWRE